MSKVCKLFKDQTQYHSAAKVAKKSWKITETCKDWRKEVTFLPFNLIERRPGP